MSAAISSAVRVLGTLLVKKVEFLGEVSGQVRLLIDELNRIQSFLKDADNKKAQDERVRTWMLDIREVAHDAEDAIEMYVHNVESSKISKGVARSITSFPKNTYYRNKVGNKIKTIRARLEDIDKSRQRYGIKHLEEAPASELLLQVEQLRRLPAWQKDEHLVGMEEDVETLLLEFVLNEENKKLAVAFLKGSGGIGKSTLAREVYNHPDVNNARIPFECRVWVVVSSEFTPQETIKQIIFELQKSKDDKKELLEEIKRLEESMKNKQFVLQKLKEMLYRQLEGKSYFIVLDDVWEKEHLESIITAFPDQDKSRLLVTSRNMITMNSDQYVHEMKVLDLVKSRELLLKKANISVTNGNIIKELQSIGTQILEKCGGLPLAISMVGGLLSGKQSSGEWQQVLHQINSYLVTADSNVSAILELSYQNLSHRLKPCFLCLALFKEDAIVSAKWLEDMWVSQCLIQHEENRTIDEVARGYLNELINRSMIQIVDLSFDDRVKNCRIHDLVREICLRKAKDEISLEIVKGEVEASSATPYKARHLVVYGNNLKISKRNKHVRSLFLINIDYEDDYVTSASTDFWKSLKLLKTLHLDGFAFRRFPDSLGLLIGLKNLRITHRRGKLEIPIWLNKLKNLEVLTVENAIVEGSKVALTMVKLQHLEFYDSMGVKIGKYCKSLETLKSILIEDWMKYNSSTVITNCPIRKLEIRVHLYAREWSDEKSSSVRTSWKKMTNLVELHLNFSISDLPLREVIPYLGSLTILRVSNLRSPTCTPASMFSPNLSHLILDSCKVGDDQLRELGKLPKLQYLALIEYKVNYYYLTRMVVLHDHFPSLQVLYLQDMWGLKNIDFEQGGMSRLKQLKFHGCPVLQTQNLPQHIVISKVPRIVL